MRRRHGGADPAAHVEFPHDLNEMGIQRGHEILQDPVRDVLMKSPLIPVGPKVALQGFQLDAGPVRDIGKMQDGEIGLPGERTQAGELPDSIST